MLTMVVLLRRRRSRFGGCSRFRFGAGLVAAGFFAGFFVVVAFAGVAFFTGFFVAAAGFLAGAGFFAGQPFWAEARGAHVVPQQQMKMRTNILLSTVVSSMLL
jgi:hypothetical protein